MRITLVACVLAQLPLRLSAQGAPPPRDTAAQRLPVAAVVGAPNPPPRLRDFYSRKEMGIGRFIERDVLQKFDGLTTAEVLATVPGVKVQRAGSVAYVASTRALTNNGCAFCGPAPVARADRNTSGGCFLDTYVDGSLVYQMAMTPPTPPGGVYNPAEGGAPMPKFDINSLPPSMIEAIEVYSGASQIPAQYNRSSAGCGVMLIWTRISPPKP